MIFREILSLPFAAFWSNFFIPFPAKYIPILRGGHSKCDVWRVPHHWEMGKTWQTKCFERKFGGCIFSVWDVYWCSQNQTWTSRAGSRTPSLDSKMCQFPGISLSELWKVRSFRLIPVNNRPKNEAFELDAGFRLWWQFLSKTSLSSFVQAKIRFFKPKSFLLMVNIIWWFLPHFPLPCLAPRPMWTLVSWKNNGDLTGFHWALAVTTWGYWVTHYTYIQYIYI